MSARRKTYDTPLRRWLETEGVSLTELASHMRVSIASVKFWADNQVLPDIINALKIERATDGAIRIESWVDTPLGRERMMAGLNHGKTSSKFSDAVQDSQDTIGVKGAGGKP